MVTFQKILIFILLHFAVFHYCNAQVKDTSVLKKGQNPVTEQGPYDLQIKKKSKELKEFNRRQSVSYEQITDTLITDEKKPLIDSAKNIVITTNSAKTKPPLPKYDSLGSRIHYPREASIRSAIIPGWGQIYNGKGWMWKVPIIYAGLGGLGWYFFDNLKYYKQLKLGTNVAMQLSKNIPKDSTGYANIKNANVKLAVDRGRLQELTFYRDRTRREVDYAAVYFVAAWALNVVWASVDAHLQSFDISPNLSFKIQPGYSELAKTSGISLVLQIK